MKPELRLYCFPWSGASSSAYLGLAAAMPSDVRVVAIRPPGGTSLETMADAIAEKLPTGRFAFFGHSFGALLAYAVARRLEVGPELVIVSGSRSPASAPPVALHALDDAELDGKLDLMGGMTPECLGDQEFMTRFRPRVRADLAVCERYRAPAGSRLDVPMSAWAGTADWYATPALARQWRHFAGHAFGLRLFSGGHFFVNDPRRIVPALLADLDWAATRSSLAAA